MNSTKRQKLKLQFDASVGLEVIDEVSMVTTELFAQIDERLRELYDPSKIFGGMSILLVGDFLQLVPVKGTSLCKNLYVTRQNDSSIKARDLFRRFKVFFSAISYEQVNVSTNSAILLLFKLCQPNIHKVPNGITKMGTDIFQNDVGNDPSWLYNLRILVTGNIDKAALIQSTTQLFGHLHNTIIIRWRRKIKEVVDAAVETALYDEDVHPYLFSYFAKNAPAQILDNSAGNLEWGIANGTECLMHSLGWDDYFKARTANELINNAMKNNEKIVDLPYPPVFINILLTDSDNNPISGEDWPPELNLETKWINNSDGTKYKPKIVIPIGIMTSNASDNKVKYSHISTEINSKPLHYLQHGVDLSFARTVWRAQGSTLKRVILLLQGSPISPSWAFEHLYVAMSRVKPVQGLRCLPLTPSFSREHFLKLRPSIFTVKWCMSIDDTGYWRSLENVV
ncbi:PIF1-like helicase [Phytophthora infestans]|uniref:ATP-dependent DNA helicase n=1 Tax=Phytophthora infestans TaxID=4787 RepID=A0A8S9UJA2_PHYIN|nr:PIF1-like helicase [Phytophthora infestans]